MSSTLKTLIAVIVMSLGLAPAASAQAQKIAYVDYQRLLSDSPQARAAAQALEAEFGPKQKQLETQRKDLEARMQKFDRDQSTMAEAERTKTQRELRDAQLTFERRAKEFQEDGQMRQNEELQRVQKLIVESVRAYAKSQGFDLVIAQGVIYSSDSVDITSQVLSNLQLKAAAATAAPATAPAAPAAAPPKK
ncbi:MAG TPA: OmpH family outer membrane protein [Steroidobacteraceae bacterium]|nr:OmpH family outer membrane protein [Steroidobacteraceae bacterium]